MEIAGGFRTAKSFESAEALDVYYLSLSRLFGAGSGHGQTEHWPAIIAGRLLVANGDADGMRAVGHCSLAPSKNGSQADRRILNHLPTYT